MKTQTFILKTAMLLQMALILLIASGIIAQVPQSFKYQAALRDETGQLMKNKALTMRVSIYEASVVRYQETHSVVTNEYGLVNIEVGRGTPVSGSISAIDWSAGEFFLQTEINAGAGYVNLGRSQLLSVPFALHAKTADEIKGGISESDPTWYGQANTSSAIGRSGNVGIGISIPTALLHTIGTDTGGGNVLFAGTLKGSPGDPPASGAGTRMMWYPDKAAFRAGQLTGALDANNWDKDSIGSNSVSMGHNTKAKAWSSTALGSGTIASGNNSTAIGFRTTSSGFSAIALGYLTIASASSSTAMGSGTEASGDASTAIGYETKASGTNSIAMGSRTEASGTKSLAIGSDTEASGDFSAAMGSSTKASGDFSTAMGLITIASGQYSTAMGSYTTAPSANETVIGRWNTDYAGSPHTWYSGQRLFVIGNGTSDQLRSNAMTVLKNGRVGLQTITNPDFALELPNSTAEGTGKGRANAWTTYSDSRVKSVKVEISYGLKEIMQLKPVKYFQHNSTFEKGELVISDEGADDIGFIAQDLYSIIPEIVNVPEDENTSLWGMNYEKLTPVLVKAIQEQQSIIEELQKQNESQKSDIESLKKMVHQQQVLMSTFINSIRTRDRQASSSINP